VDLIVAIFLSVNGIGTANTRQQIVQIHEDAFVIKGRGQKAERKKKRR
jgi:hypothetical protein